ncbi:nitroreductase family protein [Ilumatobacter coccineus]|uniref:Nitroreductase domain-containing protein n=1 Tax=Ilumatobacter coccineus (strain NBRC 103263 / KCTC 29153 / YM16-304) TaxID=1313172 RepID=A0A6C7E6C1_ILUCY|nr:nitroreductase family protein [Ilumatobacter coccineus]BAN01652.1 hypothetical protein YM304_13380 [Ilumatobacter coccineus YM16-304]
MSDLRLQATRTFSAESPSRSLVAELLDEARWCGSARNRQPWQLFVVTAPDMRSALASHAPYGAHLANAPVVVVVGLDHHRGGADTELDGGRLVQTLLRSCADRGLGSCPVTFFPATAEQAVQRIVGAPDTVSTRTAVAIGWPGDPPPGVPAIPVGRRPPEQVIRWLSG